MIKHLNPNKSTVTVRFQGDIETLQQYRESLFELIRNYDYKEYAKGLIDGDSLGTTMYYTINFLEQITNNIEKLKEPGTEKNQNSGFIDIEFECLEANEINITIRAILDLVKCYRYSDFGNSCDIPIFRIIDLIHSLLPDGDQFEAAFSEPENYYVVPENISQETDLALRSLIASYRPENSGINRQKILQSLLKSA